MHPAGRMGLCVQPSKKGSEKTPESRSVIANPQVIDLKKCQIRLQDGRAGNSKGDERVRREWLLKNVADATMGTVESLGVNPIELSHALGEIAFDRFDHNVIVIGHLAPSMTYPIKPFTDVP